MTKLNLKTKTGSYVLNVNESPMVLNGLDGAIAYADKTGYQHIIFNGMLFSKVHRDINAAFRGADTQPPDTWVKVGLYTV